MKFIEFVAAALIAGTVFAAVLMVTGDLLAALFWSGAVAIGAGWASTWEGE